MTNDLTLLEELLAALRGNKTCALLTILGTEGSVSRTSGKMLVYGDGTSSGTIGGGSIERAAKKDAVNCIKTGESGAYSYDLAGENAGKGLACGGKMHVAIEVWNAKPAFYVCGGGHVGHAVITLAQSAGYDVTLIDTRAPEDIPDAVAAADRFVRVEAFEEGILALDTAPGAAFLITTYGHAFDCEALYAALQKDTSYIGMLGSKPKREALFQKLRERGIMEEAFTRVYTPAGLDIGGQTPGEIAISIMAEVLKLKYGASGAHARTL